MEILKIGILGGTFNPIHNGHVYIACKIYRDLNLDKVLFMVNNVPPHKDSSYILSSDIRLNMVNIAIKDYEDFYVEDYEVRKEGTSYTYESLEHLKSCYPKGQLFFIIGSDSFIDFYKWRNIESIFKNAIVVVYLREDSHRNKIKKLKEQYKYLYNASIEIIECDIIHISSTDIRDMVKEGCDISSLVDKDVYNYIIKNHLYMR